MEKRIDKVALVVGAGAVKNSWNPVIRAIQKLFDAGAPTPLTTTVSPVTRLPPLPFAGAADGLPQYLGTQKERLTNDSSTAVEHHTRMLQLHIVGMSLRVL